jgi:hypothetical protein
MGTSIRDGVIMAKSSKGSQYERDVCRQLSLWWTEGKDDNSFWRTSQSGGRATTRAKQKLKTPNSYGDVGYLDIVGKPFIDKVLLELKRGYTKDISILDFLDKNRGEPILLKWWDKAEKERKLAKRKHTIIIFRRDRHKSCILINAGLFTKMIDWFGDFSRNYIIIKRNKLKLIAIELDTFLAWCHPDFFRRT